MVRMLFWHRFHKTFQIFYLKVVLASNSSPLDDLALVKLYQQKGDLEVLSKLFSRYTSMVYGVCLKYLKDRDEAKDAVMHIFEKLIKSLQGHSVENFKSWLYVTSRNHCLMALRSRKGKLTQELNPDLVENEVILHLEDDLGRLEKCMEELVSEQKRCVQLFFLEEKCYKDISSVTGFDLRQVKSFIQNGKRNLKICMEKNGG
jgi:RNA polymerase sigma-70 factor (ECF subfamily)